MPSKKGTIKSYTRTSSSGKPVEVSSYSRTEEVTLNQRNGQPDPFHNSLVANAAGQGGGEEPILYDPAKLKSFCPEAYAQVETIRKEVTPVINKLIRDHQKDIQDTIRRALKIAV